MALVTKGNTFSAGTTIKSADVNSDFDTIYNDYNGNITNANVSASAAIAASKLALSGIAQTVSYTGAPENWAQGTDIASATSTPIGAATGNFVNVTGTTTITSFDTVQAGTIRIVHFSGALTLTHNATSLILKNNGSNRTTANRDSAVFASLGSGNWEEIVYSPYGGSTYTPSVSNALSGSVIQSLNVTLSTASSTGTAIPNDNTIPQITEGAEITTLAITPNNASNLLNIRITTHLSNSAATNRGIAALFQDATANALAVAESVINSGSACETMTFSYRMAAGTTSSTTFRLRVGGDAGTCYWNQSSDAKTMGGVYRTTIDIEEIKA